MKTRSFVLLLTLALAATLPICAQCAPVGGVLFTNIAAIDGIYNLGPVFGDLQGSVAANIVSVNSDGTYTLQHYWVTTSGATIRMKPAVLTPTYPTSDHNIVAVPWGNYSSTVSGGTGKFVDATGTINYFGMADFNKSTLVLRYSGTVCYKRQQ
jgi:hypothetical protein